MDVVSRVDCFNLKVTELWQKSSTMTRVALAVAALVSVVLLSPILIPVGITYSFTKAFVVTPKEIKKETLQALEPLKEATESPKENPETALVEPKKVEAARAEAVDPSKKAFPWGTVFKVAGIAIGIGLLAWASYEAYEYFFPVVASCAAPIRDPSNGIFTGWILPFSADGKLPQTMCDLKDRIASGDVSSFRSMGGHNLMFCRDYKTGPYKGVICSISDFILDPKTGRYSGRRSWDKFMYYPTTQKEAADLLSIHDGNEFCRSYRSYCPIGCYSFFNKQLEKARNVCAETLPSYFECMKKVVSEAKKECSWDSFGRRTAAPVVSNDKIGEALEFFGFSTNARPTLAEINKRSRKLFLQFHPDRNPNNPEAAEKSVLVNVFKEALKKAFS